MIDLRGWLQCAIGMNELKRQMLQGFSNMAATIDEVRVEFEAYKGDVDAKVKTLGDRIAALEAELAKPSVDQAAVDAIFAEIKAAHAELVPATPVAQ